MKFSSTWTIALRALRRNPMRSGLTMLGIIIGVAAVIAMVAIGTGAKEQVAASIAQIGQNTVLVLSGAPSRGGVRGGFGSGFLLGIHGFYLGGIVAAAAEIAHQLAAGTVKVQRAGTGRALVVGKLRCHYASPFFPSVCSCPARSSKKSRRALRVLPSASR